MGPKKNMLASKTIWGALIALIMGVTQAFGIDILPDEQNALEGAILAGAAMLAIIGRFAAKTRIDAGILPGVILIPLLLVGCVAQQTDQQQPNKAAEQQDQMIDSYHNINIQLVIGGIPTTGETATMTLDDAVTANTPSTMTATGAALDLNGLTIKFSPEIWIDTAGGTDRSGAGAKQAGGAQDANQEGDAAADLDATLTP